MDFADLKTRVCIHTEVDEAVARARQDPTGGRSLGGEISRKLDEVKTEEREVMECAV